MFGDFMNRALLEFNIDKECLLIDFLKSNIEKSKNNIKSFISNGCCFVDDIVITKANYLLKKGDKLVVVLKQIRDKQYGLINIVYEDNYFIGINKPSGLLSVSDIKGNVSAYDIVKKSINGKLYVLHRLDRDTSGILLFCRDKSIVDKMQDNWNDVVLKRGYLAVVNKISGSGTVKSYLYEDKNFNVRSCDDPKKGKLAITDYKVIKNSKNYSLLQVFIHTGRKNQIRVHMNLIGTSILGDKKYGGNKAKRLYLHSNILEFIHPITGNKVLIKCNSDFDIL
jgi:23S rRNA pseudouridine1911/1915/1917 synthase